jgi:ketosteroid isomerase-like protein
MTRMGEHEIAVGAVARLESALRTRDVKAGVDCFVADGAVYGSDLGEQAHGHAELRVFLTRLFDQPVTLGWDLESIWARRSGDVLWFVAPGHAVLLSDDGGTERLLYRVCGVLRDEGDAWRFELFNGTAPGVPAVLS